jgi:hypothetical protein
MLRVSERLVDFKYMTSTFAIEKPIPTASDILEKYASLRCTFLANKLDASIADTVAQQAPILFFFFKHAPRWLHRPLGKIVRLRIESYQSPKTLSTHYRVFALGRRLSTFEINALVTI